MAEILIFAGNNTHPNPEKDRRGCWKRGMPVCVKPDGHTWGREETLPKFVIVKIPGVPVAKAEAFLETQFVNDSGVANLGADGRPTTYRRRAWEVAWNSLPAGIRNTLQTTGVITVSVAQIRNYLRRIRDDAQFTGLD